MSSPRTMSDVTAVADALRENDRFLLVTHENPDGDALGSILGMKLGLDALGKNSVMYLGGDTDPPVEYAFLPLDGLGRELPADAAERVLVALDCANAQRMGEAATLLDKVQLSLDIDHHHDNTKFGKINLVVPDASSTGEIVRDILRELDVDLTPEIAEALYVALVTDTGRFQYTNTSPKALRLAAELVEAGVDVHRVFQGIYESVEFAKLKLLATGARTRGDPRGRPARHLAPQADGLHRPRRGGGVRRGDHRLPPGCGRHGHGGGHPRAARASGREAAREPARIARRARRVGDRPRAWGRRPPPSGRVLERRVGRRDRGVHPARVRSCLRERLARRASSSSTSRRGRRPSRSSSGFATAREHGPGMRGRSTRSRQGFCSFSSVPRRVSRSTSSGSTSDT